jgi:hypothetical protein
MVARECLQSSQRQVAKSNLIKAKPEKGGGFPPFLQPATERGARQFVGEPRNGRAWTGLSDRPFRPALQTGPSDRPGSPLPASPGQASGLPFCSQPRRSFILLEIGVSSIRPRSPRRTARGRPTGRPWRRSPGSPSGPARRR